MHIIGIAKDSYTNDVQGGDHSQRFMQRRYGMVQEFDECPTLSIWIAD